MGNTEKQNTDIQIGEIPCPLCIIEDRYSGVYSNALFLAFNMEPYNVWEMPVCAGDLDCARFWADEDDDFPLDSLTIGKGSTPQEALKNLVLLLHE